MQKRLPTHNCLLTPIRMPKQSLDIWNKSKLRAARFYEKSVTRIHILIVTPQIWKRRLSLCLYSCCLSHWVPLAACFLYHIPACSLHRSCLICWEFPLLPYCCKWSKRKETSGCQIIVPQDYVGRFEDIPPLATPSRKHEVQKWIMCSMCRLNYPPVSLNLRNSLIQWISPMLEVRRLFTPSS